MKRNRKGFTLVELLVVVGIIALLLSILLPSLAKAKEITNRTKCAANLRGIAQGMQVYAGAFGDSFPMAGKRSDLTTDDEAVGFVTSARTAVDLVSSSVTTYMEGNATASLWILVRQGSASTDLFICPSTGDSADDLTTNADPAVPTPVDSTWDFKNSDNLSYSPVHMFNQRNGGQWSSSAGSQWAILGDKNNANDPTDAVHTGYANEANQTTDDIVNLENSENHSNGEGQNFVFGDGHAKFFTDPFQGPSSDNVFARQTAIVAATGVVTNILDDATYAKGDGSTVASGITFANDVVLLPLTTVNNGGTDVEGLEERGN